MTYIKYLEVHTQLFVLLQWWQVIISYCCDLDYIPKRINWEMFYETMPSVSNALGTCPLRGDDYLRIMKPRIWKPELRRDSSSSSWYQLHGMTETHIQQAIMMESTDFLVFERQFHSFTVLFSAVDVFHLTFVPSSYSLAPCLHYLSSSHSQLSASQAWSGVRG